MAVGLMLPLLYCCTHSVAFDFFSSSLFCCCHLIFCEYEPLLLMPIADELVVGVAIILKMPLMPVNSAKFSMAVFVNILLPVVLSYFDMCCKHIYFLELLFLFFIFVSFLFICHKHIITLSNMSPCCCCL